MNKIRFYKKKRFEILSDNEIYKISKNDSIFTHINLLLNNNNYNQTKIIKTCKRLIDNCIKNNCCKSQKSFLTLYFILKNYLLKNDDLFSFSSINIILSFFIINKYFISRNYFYIENNKYNLFDTIINIILEKNKKNSNLKPNISFINNFIDYIFINMKNNVNCNYNYYLDNILPIIINRNIYLNEININRLLYIKLYYNNFYLNNFYLDNFQITNKCKIYKSVNKNITFLISKNILDYNIVKLHNTINCIPKYIIKSNNNQLASLNKHLELKKYFISSILYQELINIKNILFKNDNKWCNIIYKNLINHFNIYNIYNSKIIIIDGRNTLYINNNNDFNNLNLKLLNIYLNKSVYNNVFIIFNYRHKKLLCKYIENYLISKNYGFKLYNTISNNKYNNFLKLTIVNKDILNNIYLIFTPTGVDDDLMTIYLKLTFPYAKLKSNDKYGKYFEIVKRNNDYSYDLLKKICNIHN
jgi:hypothetical protein